MNIAILAGSNRKNATSTGIARYIQTRLEQEGCYVRLFDCYEHPIPFYNPDADDIKSESLNLLRSMMLEADAIVLATPEYHGSMSGVLKNALDYLSSEHFDSKPVLSVSSAGGAVGVSSLSHLQAIVRNLHGINCPEWISVGGAQRSLNSEDEPADPAVRNRVLRVIEYFLRMTKELSGLRIQHR